LHLLDERLIELLAGELFGHLVTKAQAQVHILTEIVIIIMM